VVWNGTIDERYNKLKSAKDYENNDDEQDPSTCNGFPMTVTVQILETMKNMTGKEGIQILRTNRHHSIGTTKSKK